MQYVYKYLVLLFTVISSITPLYSQDTIFVKAFEFDDYKTNGYKGMIKFPPKSERIEKVLMKYKLRCPYDRNCGEWDYLAYVYLHNKTDIVDTIKKTAPNFRVNGEERDSLVYIKETSYTYTFNNVTGEVDSIASPPMVLVLYEDENNPTTPTDTFNVWTPYYRYVFDGNGNKTDSVLINAGAQTIYKVTYEWFEYQNRIERFELARYITPYGNWLTPAWKGFEWTYDVSDFRPLLTDSNFIDAGSLYYGWTPGGWYELLELTFVFIKGIPPRDVIAVKNVWNGNPAYGVSDNPISRFLTPKRFTLTDEEKNARLRLCVTGHGFGGTDNCAEFCAKTHEIIANGETAFEEDVFRRDCGLNPVFPQAGTWLYDRAGWCPGAEVVPYDIELSPILRNNKNLVLSYNVENYLWNRQGSTPYYAIESQLITYGEPNFKNDVAVTEIITPNNHEYFSRMNPICNNPRIIIKNTGSEILNSAVIEYGVKGQKKATFAWKGYLTYLESETVTLPPFVWGTWQDTTNVFEVAISDPNGKSDEYLPNNLMRTAFYIPARMDSSIIIRVATNRRSNQNSWRITNTNGRIVAQRRANQMLPEELHRDTVILPPGCYRFDFLDSGKDGLQFFVNDSRDGVGSVGIRNTNSSDEQYKFFEANFGTRIEYHFTVGYHLNEDSIPHYAGRTHYKPINFEGFAINPNPNNGTAHLVFDLPTPQNVQITVYNQLGQIVKELDFQNVSYETKNLDLQENVSGVYFVRMKTSEGITTKKFIIQK